LRQQAARAGSCVALYQSSGMGWDGRRGAEVGCLRWLSDDEHGGVRSGEAVEEEEKRGAPR
jgi:hypothetical protein